MEETKRCVECRKAIQPRASLCVECGSHQDWRRHIKTWTPVLGFILAFLAFVISIAPQIRSSFFPSPPKISAQVSSVSARNLTILVSNLGERRLIIDPVLKCVSADTIDEEIVDYEEPFRVWSTTVEGQLENPLTVAELGGNESATFSISENLVGSWLEHEPLFLPPDDERVSAVSGAFSLGLGKGWIGINRSSNIPTFHIIGEDNEISLQPVSEIATFCQLSMLDPVTGEQLNEGFAVWSIGSGRWRGGRANQLYNVLGSLISLGALGLNETDPQICAVESSPSHCITAD
ncbi:hypothetical protein [Paracoccus tegillarcae]|uniref:hypothetical protein n=1 Tax=Paracoccus tegillarcae TaxID=1529068 RepID=UPI001300A9EE|nr:hypothetical protein [Paracoccus tegillarcae]